MQPAGKQTGSAGAVRTKREMGQPGLRTERKGG